MCVACVFICVHIISSYCESYIDLSFLPNVFLYLSNLSTIYLPVSSVLHTLDSDLGNSFEAHGASACELHLGLVATAAFFHRI